MQQPLLKQDLDYAGTIIGYKIINRPETTPLITFYIKDDNWWSEIFSLDITWTNDLIAMTQALVKDYESGLKTKDKLNQYKIRYKQIGSDDIKETIPFFAYNRNDAIRDYRSKALDPFTVVEVIVI